MKRKFGLVALVILTTWGLSSPAMAEACVVNDPTGTPLNVRKAPNGQIVGALNNGITVSVRDRRGDWVKIVPHEAPGKSGWVFREYLDCSESSAAENEGHAADKISYPATMLGTWCQVKAEDGWTFFERGKCTETTTLVLKQNGDYVLTTGEHEDRCKANPKSYFKGWTDYVCTNVFGRVKKRTQKWTIDNGPPRTLGLSTVEP